MPCFSTGTPNIWESGVVEAIYDVKEADPIVDPSVDPAVQGVVPAVPAENPAP